VRFIRPDVWIDMGVRNAQQFKNRFGLWEQRKNAGGKGTFPALIRYLDLPILKAVAADVGDRRLKSEVLDLPEKIYTRRTFELNPSQRRVYDELEKEYHVELDNGSEVTAELALVRMLRMSQIASGYVGNDDDELVPLGVNVRMKCLKDTLEDIEGHVIIWGRYNIEIDAIRAMLGETEAVYYDGRTSDDDKAAALVKFQREGSARFFVAKPSAAGEGLTLHRAKTVIYVSNSFSLRERLQSEDRAHRAGMSNEPVTYIDLVAKSTLDGYILRALRKKRNLAAEITGDDLPSWA
jgi:SNF2 family DNA or RNA helicase